MKLNIADRILIVGLLPTQYDYETMKKSLDLRSKLGFNEEEIRKFDIVTKQSSDGRYQVTFNEEVAKDYYKDIPIPGVVKSYLVSLLKDMNEKKQLDERTITLYEKFVL